MTRRVVILTAAVGEGHVAAASVLAAELRELEPTAEVVVVDALEAFGSLLRLILLDSYRLQLRVVPWLFGLFYGLFIRLRWLRRLGRAGLVALGARGLERSLLEHDPDLVVSTYPAATSVLGFLRRSGRVSCVAVATITDLGGIAFWAHQGVDLHLVMDPALICEVEREAGLGSALPVRPLVANRFRFAPSRIDARSVLSLPSQRTIAVVSGGGWGVGDLEGAVATARASLDAFVVCVVGRDTAKCDRLAKRFAADRDVRVLGFVEQMPELLAAADVLVHTTGGVTCLEALVCGCPIVAYGVPAGHGPTVSRNMAALNIAPYARTRQELVGALRSACEAGPSLVGEPAGVTAAAAVLAARRRVVAKPASRRVRVVFASVIAAAVTGVLVSSDDVSDLLATMGLGLQTHARVRPGDPRGDQFVKVPEGLAGFCGPAGSPRPHASCAAGSPHGLIIYV